MAANAVPSARDLQAYEIYLVSKAQIFAELARAAGNEEFFAAAASALVFCAQPARSAPRYGERGNRLFAFQAATIAWAFAMLPAMALGLGSGWVGAFDDDAVRRVIKAPAGLIRVAILPVGYAAQKRKLIPCWPLDARVHEVTG